MNTLKNAAFCGASIVKTGAQALVTTGLVEYGVGKLFTTAAVTYAVPYVGTVAQAALMISASHPALILGGAIATSFAIRPDDLIDTGKYAFETVKNATGTVFNGLATATYTTLGATTFAEEKVEAAAEGVKVQLENVTKFASDTLSDAKEKLFDEKVTEVEMTNFSEISHKNVNFGTPDFEVFKGSKEIFEATISDALNTATVTEKKSYSSDPLSDEESDDIQELTLVCGQLGINVVEDYSTPAKDASEFVVPSDDMENNWINLNYAGEVEKPEGFEF